MAACAVALEVVSAVYPTFAGPPDLLRSRSPDSYAPPRRIELPVVDRQPVSTEPREAVEHVDEHRRTEPRILGRGQFEPALEPESPLDSQEIHAVPGFGPPEHGKSLSAAGSSPDSTGSPGPCPIGRSRASVARSSSVASSSRVTGSLVNPECCKIRSTPKPAPRNAPSAAGTNRSTDSASSPKKSGSRVLRSTSPRTIRAATAGQSNVCSVGLPATSRATSG